MSDKKDLDKMSLQELVDKTIDDLNNMRFRETPDGPDIARDLMGNPYNAKYPPDPERYGHSYDGYKTWNQSAFFHAYAVQYYDLEFTYHGKTYYLGFFDGQACFCREPFNEPYIFYPTGNTLLEQYLIEGIPLVKLIDDLGSVDVF